MEITTGRGDDGSTGLLFGGRVPKDHVLPRAYGAVDEAQAAIGAARAEVRGALAAGGSAQWPASHARDLDGVLVSVCRDLWVLMAELATLAENRDRLTEGTTAVSEAMVAGLDAHLDDVGGRFDPPTEFVVPGQDRTAALLDVARTVTRRAERDAVAAAAPGSRVVTYLNRLSDLLWALARWQEGVSLPTRTATEEG